jgi:putative ABC transport system permease protein
MAKEMKSYGANITLVPNGENMPLEIGGVDYNPLKGRVFIEERDLPKIRDIFWRNNIVGYAPFLKVPAELEGRARRTAALIGTRFDTGAPDDADFRIGVRPMNSYWRVEGRWP